MFYLGGNVLNVVVFVWCLGYDIFYIGIFGSDEVVDYVLNVLKLEKVNVDLICWVYGENGMVVVIFDERGDRIFVGLNKGGV